MALTPCRVLAWTSALYVLMLPLRFTEAGQEAANRSGEFLYVGIGIVLATMLVGGTQTASRGRTRATKRLRHAWWRSNAAATTTAFAVCVVMFTGGVAVSWNFAARLYPPPSVSAVPKVTTPDDIVAARWFLREYGPNHRIATDITTGLAFVTDGDQDVLSGASDGAHVWRIFFPSEMTRGVYNELANSKVQFVVIQKQLTEGVPPSAVVPVYDAGEPARNEVRPINVASEQKFASAVGVSRVYGSGTITIYRVNLDQARMRAGLT